MTERSFHFDLHDTWTVDVYGSGKGAYVDFYRNGVSMGGGFVGFQSVVAGPSGQRGAQPKVYPDAPGYRVNAADELWLLRRLQEQGVIESAADMSSRAIETRHRRRMRTAWYAGGA